MKKQTTKTSVKKKYFKRNKKAITTNIDTTKKAKVKSPNNYRKIPEGKKQTTKIEKVKKTNYPVTIYRFTQKYIIANKIFLISFLCGFIAMAIVLQGYQLKENIDYLGKVHVKRSSLMQEISYWQGIITTYKGYRDAYFKLATLEEQLGNYDFAKLYLHKVVSLDPNFQPAMAMAQKIGM